MAVEYFSTPGNWVKLLNSNDEAEYMVYWLIPGTLKDNTFFKERFQIGVIAVFTENSVKRQVSLSRTGLGYILQPGQDWDPPPPPPEGWGTPSRPLAFMQEDFLLLLCLQIGFTALFTDRFYCSMFR